MTSLSLDFIQDKAVACYSFKIWIAEEVLMEKEFRFRKLQRLLESSLISKQHKYFWLINQMTW